MLPVIDGLEPDKVINAVRARRLSTFTGYVAEGGVVGVVGGGGDGGGGGGCVGGGIGDGASGRQPAAAVAVAVAGAGAGAGAAGARRELGEKKK